MDEAEYDLTTAEALLKEKRYSWACFITQQAAEKAVKALRILRGEQVPRIHSVLALMQGDKDRGLPPLQGFESVLEEARELDRHYIPSRYPNAVPFGKPYEFYDRRKGEECLQCARKILEVARRMLENS